MRPFGPQEQLFASGASLCETWRGLRLKFFAFSTLAGGGLMRFWRPRFSMRFVLITMLVIGAVLGIVGREMMRLRTLAREQWAIIRPLEAKGALFDIQGGVNRSPVEPLMEWMEGKPIPDVKSISLQNGIYSAADIEQIARLDRVVDIAIVRGECNDTWLAALAKARGTERIYVKGGKCTAEGAHAIAASKAPLKLVALLDFQVDDEFLRIIAKHPDLEVLAIQGEGVTAAGIAELADAQKLSVLQLFGGTKLADGFAELADHPHIRSLMLSDYEWSSEDLAVLERLESVTSLSVSTTKRLPKGILRAAATAPKLRYLCLGCQFDEAESVEDVTFAKLEKFMMGRNDPICEGLLGQLATCRNLRAIEIPNGQVSEEELLELGKLPHLDTFTIGGSPSNEAIKKFQQAKPYCVYVDGQRGALQPLLGINPAKMGRGVWTGSIAAPAPASGS
jgi:hypothetical protein